MVIDRHIIYMKYVSRWDERRLFDRIRVSPFARWNESENVYMGVFVCRTSATYAMWAHNADSEESRFSARLSCVWRSSIDLLWVG